MAPTFGDPLSRVRVSATSCRNDCSQRTTCNASTNVLVDTASHRCARVRRCVRTYSEQVQRTRRECRTPVVSRRDVLVGRPVHRFSVHRNRSQNRCRQIGLLWHRHGTGVLVHFLDDLHPQAVEGATLVTQHRLRGSIHHHLPRDVQRMASTHLV